MTKPIPEGYGTVTPFLSLAGASDAIELYKKAFGATELDRVPAPDGKLMHAEIQIGTSRIMLGDVMMGAPVLGGLHIYVEDCDAMWKRATEAGLKIEMPIGDMFWGDRYGVLSDKFGVRWSIATHQEDMSPEKMKQRMDAEMAEMTGAAKPASSAKK